MADISDVTGALVTIAASAIYPNGTGQPAVTGSGVRIFEGWPNPAQLDAAVASGTSMVSVYPVPGTTGKPPQVFDWDPGAVTAPVHGLTVSADDITATISGTSTIGEAVMLIVDRVNHYTHVSSITPETAAVIAAALAAEAAADYAGASSTAGVISIPGSHEIIARRGSLGMMGQKIHRQSQQIRVVTWSPNPAHRTIIAKAVDVAIKNALRIEMPDSSQVIISLDGTNLSDKEETAGVYRRDLMITALFDTIFEYSAMEVLAVETPITLLPPQ